MPTEKPKNKAEQLAELKRELSVVKLSLSIVGERSEGSSELMAKRASVLEKITKLESGL